MSARISCIRTVFGGVNKVCSVHRSLSRNYAVQMKAPRDRAISAPFIKLVGLDGKFQGIQRTSDVLRSFDPSSHTLLNLTPNQEEPTCRLYTKAELKEMETKAYTASREKKKAGSDPGRVLKECTLNWNVTEHDLQHKLDSALNALRKGNRVDISIGLRTRRGAKVTTQDVRQELLDKVVSLCNKEGKETKTREGSLESGVILHYTGNAPKN